MGYFRADTAIVSENAQIGVNTKVWHHSQIREGAKIGEECIIGKNVYVDDNVVIGDRVKIQNNASLFYGVTIENGVFIGPHVCFTNDKYPRAINEDGSLKSVTDWEVSPILVKEGASIGANATILPGVIIGKYAMIGSGSVVTQDVLDFTLVYGNPAKPKGIVNKLGRITSRR